MNGTVILSHGLESGPDATKVSALAEVAEACGWASVRPDYRSIDAARDVRAIGSRVDMALAHAPTTGRVIFAGSSMGAFISGLASLRRASAGVFLMALPVDIPGYPQRFDAATVPTTMVHGWRDGICPVEAAIAFAGERRARLHLVDDDHRLGGHVAFCAARFRDFLAGAG